MNTSFQRIVNFSKKYRWSKYLCVVVLTVLYLFSLVADFFASNNVRIRKFGKRVVTGVCAFAFSFMILPLVSAEEITVSSEEDGDYYIGEVDSFDIDGAVPDELEVVIEAPMHTVSVFTDNGSLFGADFGDYVPEQNIYASVGEGSADTSEKIMNAFKGYGISTDDLNFYPVLLSVYDISGEQLGLECEVSISAPIPDNMTAHCDELRVVRLDSDRIVILDSEVKISEDGYSYVVFRTDVNSDFALVAYSDNAETLRAAAGIAVSGDAIVLSSTEYDFPEIKKKNRLARGTHKYRILNRIKKVDCIF